jgi:methionyl-tRNA synthetase
VLTQKYFNGRVPKPEDLDNYDNEVLNCIASYRDRVEDNLDHFRFREALKEAMNLARLGNKYLADTEPWKHFKNDPGRVKNILYTALQITASIAGIVKPFLPFTALKLEEFLNAGEIGWQDIGNTSLLPVGHEINQPELLFEKIEDATIQAQLDKLANSKKMNEARESGLPDLKEEISYEDFSKMDIRVAKILAAEKVPKTNKLIKLDLDTGFDKRTVVSGIAEYFKPEEIIGKQVCILANLAPRNLRGIVSHGMVLLAEDASGKLIFVKPEDSTDEGSAVL